MEGSDWRRVLDALRVEPKSRCPACRGSGLDLDHATYTYSGGFMKSATFQPCPNACWRWGQ